MSQSERMARLNPRRREIVRPVLEHPQQFVLLSVRDLAAKLRTDPATIVRIAQGLGFETYKDFQRYLHQLSVAHATSFDSMQSALAHDSTVTARLQHALEQEVKNVRALHHGVDMKRLVAVARRLWAARRILLLGGDLAASLVSYADYHLTVLGLPAVSATSPGRATHLVRACGKGDVVVGISFRRGLRLTVEGIQAARKQGAYCVGITDTYISPIARFSHEFFVASVNTPSFGASYTAPMAVLSLLHMACGEVRRAKTLELMKKADEEQRHGFRWYEA